MRKSLCLPPLMAALSTFALSASAQVTQPGLLDFPLASNQVGLPEYPTKGGDSYSDDLEMRFRKGQSSFEAPLTTVATFESIGIYWAPPSSRAEGLEKPQDKHAQVLYRKQGDTDWLPGLPLWFDTRNREYRGSLVGLTAGTSYEISLSLRDEAGTTATTTQATWIETANLPQGKDIDITKAEKYKLNSTYTITKGGDATEYAVYTAPAGQTTIDMNGNTGSATSCLVIQASYVIVRGMKLANCQRQGIEIVSPAHDVIIEQNDISGFGSAPPGTPPAIPLDQSEEQETSTIIAGTEYEAGIYCQNVRAKIDDRVRRVVIQRNKIHDPRYGSIPWIYAHPNSAQGIMFSHCGGNHVIRYNDIYAKYGHYFNDGIGGLSNFTFEGFPGADSDIYGNDISGVYDDAIESEGGNRNVRIWANYLHHVYTGIALATTSQGPVYAFRNVITDTVGMYNPNATVAQMDTLTHGVMFKLGSDQPGVNGGRIYLFHNSSLQPPAPAGLVNGPGVSSFATQFNSSTAATCNIVSRNNLTMNSNAEKGNIKLNNMCGGNDLDYDAYYGNITNANSDVTMIEPHGKQGKPSNNPVLLETGTAALPSLWLRDLNDATSAATYTAKRIFLSLPPKKPGDFQLKPTSLGYGMGLYLPNFSDVGGSIDAGAHQHGKPNFEYGSAAYLNSGK